MVTSNANFFITIVTLITIKKYKIFTIFKNFPKSMAKIFHITNIVREIFECMRIMDVELLKLLGDIPSDFQDDLRDHIFEDLFNIAHPMLILNEHTDELLPEKLVIPVFTLEEYVNFSCRIVELCRNRLHPGFLILDWRKKRMLYFLGKFIPFF